MGRAGTNRIGSLISIILHTEIGMTLFLPDQALGTTQEMEQIFALVQNTILEIANLYYKGSLDDEIRPQNIL